jgi:hypothetical protein
VAASSQCATKRLATFSDWQNLQRIDSCGDCRADQRTSKQNTIVGHGRYRTVKPHAVFEAAFNSIQPGTRRAGGLALRLRQSKKSDAIRTTIPSIARNMRVSLPSNSKILQAVSTDAQS